MMNRLGFLLAGAVLWAAPFAFAEVPEGARTADIVFLGEVHDNPAHHERQADWVAELAPGTLVFEMIAPGVAEDLPDATPGDADALAAALNWAESGWPDFGMYHPIFLAAPEARIRGAAVARSEARALDANPLPKVFGSRADVFGLDRDLPPEEQAAREDLQFAAHCDALPKDFLPMMVAVQRLRDAMLARAALEAHEDGHGPVVVITGNGHARSDWGAPALLAGIEGLRVFSLGQSEDDVVPDGRFDLVLGAPPVDRPDPCAAFR